MWKNIFYKADFQYKLKRQLAAYREVIAIWGVNAKVSSKTLILCCLIRQWEISSLRNWYR